MNKTMTNQPHHFFTATGLLYVDSAFLRAVGDLVHLGWGDFATRDGRATFLRRDSEMEAPTGFVGRIHIVGAEPDVHAALVASTQSLATPTPPTN